MSITKDRPTIAERLASSGNSPDLSVNIETRGDADLLIAAGSSKAVIGRYVYQLMTEWDACAKPRPITEADIQKIAERLPRVKRVKAGKRGPRTVEALDTASARVQLDEWLAGERRRILGRLQALPKLMDQHAGLLPWVEQQGYAKPREKLLDVLGWWADRRCPACLGTAERGSLACKTCKGFGQREIPHGLEGLAISEHIAREVDRARRNTIDSLKGIRNLKEYAAGVG